MLHSFLLVHDCSHVCKARTSPTLHTLLQIIEFECSLVFSAGMCSCAASYEVNEALLGSGKEVVEYYSLVPVGYSVAEAKRFLSTGVHASFRCHEIDHPPMPDHPPFANCAE